MRSAWRAASKSRAIDRAGAVGLLIASVLATPCTSQERPKAAASSALKLVLRSLPSSTESFIVLGPYKPQPPAPPAPIGYAANGSPLYAPEASVVKDLTTEWEAFRCNTALLTVDPQLKSYCSTRETELSIFAFRALNTEFNIPGGTKIEGCQVLVFKDVLDPSIQALFDRPIAEIAGVAVAEITPKPAPADGPDKPRVVGAIAPQVPKERTFLAIPYDRMLVASNSWTVLTHVLTAMRNPSTPDNGLRPTRDADQARLWGVRRFKTSFARDGTAAVVQRDANAKQLEMSYDAAVDAVALRYVSTDKSAEVTLQRFFSALGETAPPVRRLDAETVELSMGQPAHKWILVLAVLGMLALP